MESNWACRLSTLFSTRFRPRRHLSACWSHAENQGHTPTGTFWVCVCVCYRACVFLPSLSSTFASSLRLKSQISASPILGETSALPEVR